MSPEPRNAASDRTRAGLPDWSDRHFIATKGRAQLADDFLHEDRRLLVATPPMDADTYVGQALQLFAVYDSFELTVDEIVAVRGERWCLCVRSRIIDDWSEPQLAILQFDEQVDRLERYIGFDVEQLDEAIAELDRMSADRHTT